MALVAFAACVLFSASAQAQTCTPNAAEPRTIRLTDCGGGPGAGRDNNTEAFNGAVAYLASLGRGGELVIDGQVTLGDTAPITTNGITVRVTPGSFIYHDGTGALFTVQARYFRYEGGFARIYGNSGLAAFLLEGAQYAAIRDAWITAHRHGVYLRHAAMNNDFYSVRMSAISDYGIRIESVANNNRFFGGQMGNGVGGNVYITGATSNVFWMAMEGGMNCTQPGGGLCCNDGDGALCCAGDTPSRVYLGPGAAGNRFFDRLEADPGILLVRGDANSNHNVFSYVIGLNESTMSTLVSDEGNNIYELLP